MSDDASLTKWLFHFLNMDAAPEPFVGRDSPRVREFTDVRRYVGNCASVLRIARQLAIGSRGEGRNEGESGKRRGQQQGGGVSKRTEFSF